MVFCLRAAHVLAGGYLEFGADDIAGFADGSFFDGPKLREIGHGNAIGKGVAGGDQVTADHEFGISRGDDEQDEAPIEFDAVQRTQPCSGGSATSHRTAGFDVVLAMWAGGVHGFSALRTPGLEDVIGRMIVDGGLGEIGGIGRR